MIKRTLKRRSCSLLAVLTLWLTSGLAQAYVFLIGTPEGHPGDEVQFSIAVTPGTTFSSIDIIPNYQSFAGVLTLLDFKGSSALEADGTGQCSDADGMCVFFYLDGKSFPEETVLAALRFRVSDNAYDFVDANGEVPFDLGADVGVDLVQPPKSVPLPEGQTFRVLGVPEPSSYCVMAVGVLLLIGNRYRRRSHNS